MLSCIYIDTTYGEALRNTARKDFNRGNASESMASTGKPVVRPSDGSEISAPFEHEPRGKDDLSSVRNTEKRKSRRDFGKVEL